MTQNADALFLGITDKIGGSTYQPVLAFETRGEMMMFVPGTSESIDPRISTFLSGGFELLYGELWHFPYLEDWHIRIDEEANSFALVNPQGLPAYSVELTEVTPEWLTNLGQRDQCVVITGTNLGLDLSTFTFEVIQAAAKQGTVVAGIVPTTPGSGRGSWWSRLTSRLRRD
jgi:hypothetical protein